MDFRILGPLEVVEDGRAIELGAAKQQAVLATLLLHANNVVSVSRLINDLWGDAPPATATKVVQGYVSNLRKVLGGGTIITRSGGYLALVEPDRLDASRFESLAAEGRAYLTDDPARAIERFQRALGLWRGEPVEGLDLQSVARGETQRLMEEQLSTLELRIEAELALGKHADLVLQLPRLVTEHPYREHLRAHLMLALYRCGRQVEALATYQNARQVLVSELGIEPSRELQILHERILAHDPELDLSVHIEEAGGTTADERPVTLARRLVTVLVIASFVKGTSVDPESMYRLIEKHTEKCVEIIGRHGGSLQGFGGDTIVGVFGLTELHEDDAVRAMRAAVEIRATAADVGGRLQRDIAVGIALRVGIESGAVFVGGRDPRQRFAAGDAVELASALAHGAKENEILLGEHALSLTSPVVSVDALDPLALPTRSETVPRWRLNEVRTRAHQLPSSAAFVGRDADLQQLRMALARAQAESSCRLVTVVGPAGIGKSRLTREFISAEDDVAVLIGHCLSYGESITYHPLAEIVSQLVGSDLVDGIRELLQGEPRAESIERQLLAAIGQSDESTQTEETFWAVRKVIERASQTHPLIIVVDDVHWAEATLLDLLDHLTTFSSGSAILLVCLSRPELLEAFPSWAIPQHNRSVLMLDPLTDAQAYQLVDALDAGRELGLSGRTRAVATAEGNPFFLEQIVAVSAAGSSTHIPLSIQAVLAARIDRLESGERNLLGLAAVAGRSFRRADLAGLLDEDGLHNIGNRLASLVHKQLIRPDRPEVRGQDTFRFVHALIRDAAYEALPKQLRAQLHERIATRLKAISPPQAEIIGYHLERAYRFFAELGLIGDRERALATEGAEWLDSSARAAFFRGDLSGGATLLERAVSLYAHEDARRLALLPRLGEALFEAGRLKDAERVVNGAIVYARAQGRADLEARADVERQRVRIQAGSAWSVAEADRVADTALEVLSRFEDDIGQCRAWCLHATVRWILGRALAADEAWAHASEYAERVGNNRELFEILCWRASAAAYGPIPVNIAIRTCDEIRDRVASSPVAVAATLHPLALLHAMNGDFVHARRLIRDADAILDDLGRLESTVSHQEASVELLAEQPAMAETKLASGYARLEAMGERSLLATTAAMLAQAALAQGHDEVADKYCRVSEQTTAVDDLPAQATWRGARAKILAKQAKFDDAEAYAREAVRLALGTDFTTTQGDSFFDLGIVLNSAGHNAEAEKAVRQALALYLKKGDRVSAQRARSWLASSTSAKGAPR